MTIVHACADFRGIERLKPKALNGALGPGTYGLPIPVVDDEYEHIIDAGQSHLQTEILQLVLFGTA